MYVPQHLLRYFGARGFKPNKHVSKILSLCRCCQSFGDSSATNMDNVEALSLPSGYFVVNKYKYLLLEQKRSLI
jgi:hypothetical protein